MSEAIAEEVDDIIDQNLEEEGHVEEGTKPATTEIEPKEPNAMESALAELARSQKTIVERLDQKPTQKDEKMTPEQEAEFWAIYDPEATNKEFMRKWFRMNPEATEDEIKEAREMFKDVQRGLVKQSVKGAKNYVDHMIDRIRAEYEPALKFVETARAEATRGRFFKDYPVLKEKKYEKILAAAAVGLSNKEFNDEPSYFKALAESAAEAVKGIVPDFDLGKPQTPPAGKPKLNRTHAGGGGGAGSGRSTAADTSGDQSAEIFDEND